MANRKPEAIAADIRSRLDVLPDPSFWDEFEDDALVSFLSYYPAFAKGKVPRSMVAEYNTAMIRHRFIPAAEKLKLDAQLAALRFALDEDDGEC